MKKGTLAINVIIIAAICLVVMIIVIAIFGGNIRTWSTGLADCKLRGGHCDSRCVDGEETEIANTNCKSPDPVCCVRILDS